MSAIVQSIHDNFNALPIWAKAVVGATAAAAASCALLHMNKRRASPYKKDFVPGVVYLYQFGRTHFVPSLSPFCVKLETWLRMEGIKYENVEIPLAVRSKEGTLPFIELDGIEYDDSGFIIRDLTEIFKKGDKEANLANEQKAVARAFEQMAENSTIWSFIRVRYLDKYNELATAEIIGAHMAYYLKFPFVRWSFQSKIRNKLIASGIGKHSGIEADGIGIDDIRAISNYLGVKRFFLGEQPHRVDATLFGLLSQIVYYPVQTPHKEFIEIECPNLIKYCDRIKDKFWTDWNEICEKLVLNTSHNLK